MLRAALVFFLIFVVVEATLSVDLPWISVSKGTDRFYLADPQGREVILHGVNVEFLQRELDPQRRSINPADYDGKCPVNREEYYEPPVCQMDAGKGMYEPSTDFTAENDFAQMRLLGFNVVRLCLNWNLLEPQPGNYSQEYIERIAQVVGWAKEQGMYILLDMHQDQYSRFVFGSPAFNYPPYLEPQDGQDGAPAWAVETDGWPGVAIYGQGPLNLAVMAAVDNFYDNLVIPGLPQGDAPGPGLQDHFIGAIALLAKRFKNESAVLGYEIMNEPPPGFHLEDMVAFSADYLYPLYTRVIQAITGVRDGLPTCPSDQPSGPGCAYPSLGVEDTRHLIFFEPMAIRNQFDVSFQNSVPFTNYTNIVYAPHVYTHIFTIDQVLGLPPNNTIYPPGYDFAFSTARAEANAMNAAVFVTEFGGASYLDNITLVGTLEAQERSKVGSTMWSWKSNTGTDVSGVVDNMWSVYAGPVLVNNTMQQNGPIIVRRREYISRVYPRAVVGELLNFHYESQDHSFVLHAQSTVAGDTEIYIPPTVGGTVGASGNAAVGNVTVNPDGSRLASINVYGKGPYQVTVVSPGGTLPPFLPMDSSVLVKSASADDTIMRALDALAALGEALAQVKGRPDKLPYLLALLKTSDRLKPLREKAPHTKQ